MLKFNNGSKNMTIMFTIMAWHANAIYLNLVEHQWEELEFVKAPPYNLQDLTKAAANVQIEEHTVSGYVEFMESTQY